MLSLQSLATPATTKKTQSCSTSQASTEVFSDQHSSEPTVNAKKKMNCSKDLTTEELRVEDLVLMTS